MSESQSRALFKLSNRVTAVFCTLTDRSDAPLEQLARKELDKNFTMENSGSMNENGEKTGEKDETTELFHNIGQKVTTKEMSFLYVNDSPTSPRRDDLDDQNCINIEGDHLVEPITEPSHVAITKTPETQGSNENESKEDGNTTVQDLLLKIGSIIGATMPKENGKLEVNNKEDAVDEDEPIVVQRRTQEVSLQPEVAINELAPYVIEKTPAPLHLKPLIFEGEESKEKDEDKTDGNLEEPNSVNEIKEAGRILEDEFVVIEKKPCVLESEVLVENKNPEDETNTDESMESLLVNIQSVIDCPSEERREEKMLDIKGDSLEEDTPVVVEKRPIAFHVGVVNQDEKKGETSEVKEPVSETEVIVVEKESVPFESEILAEKESNDDSKEDESVTVETLLFDIDSVIDHPSSVAESASEIEHEALEDAPIVIEKKPTSLQIEQVRDRVEDASQNETDRNQIHSGDIEEVKDFRGPMSDAEIMVIEKKTAEIESELLIEQEEDQNDSATLESLLVNIESVIDATAPEQTEKKKDFVEDDVQETVPLAVNNRAIEIHHELLVVHSDERYELKPEDTEAEPVPPKSKVLAAQKEISAITVTTTRHTEITQTPKSVVTVIPAEESLKSASYSNLVSGDDKKDKTELLLQVPVRRLSAPEVLPEKENDGSAPLASSDSGLLDPLLESSPRVHDKLEKKIDQEAEIVSTDREPYRDVSEEQKLIGDTLEDVEGISQKKDSAQTPPNAEDEQELLDIVNEEKSDEDKLTKKEGKGISSPQCKCCSLM